MASCTRINRQQGGVKYVESDPEVSGPLPAFRGERSHTARQTVLPVLVRGLMRVKAVDALWDEGAGA